MKFFQEYKLKRAVDKQHTLKDKYLAQLESLNPEDLIDATKIAIIETNLDYLRIANYQLRSHFPDLPKLDNNTPGVIVPMEYSPPFRPKAYSYHPVHQPTFPKDGSLIEQLMYRVELGRLAKTKYKVLQYDNTIFINDFVISLFYNLEACSSYYYNIVTADCYKLLKAYAYRNNKDYYVPQDIYNQFHQKGQ